MIQFPKPDVEKFFRTLTVQNFIISPDEKQLVISTNLNGHFNLWAMDLPNQFPYPLTFKNQSVQDLHYAKTAEFIIAGFDNDGDENTQLYALAPNGGELVPLRVSNGNRHFFSYLTKDCCRLYYVTTRNNSTYLNTYLYNIETGDEELLLEGKKAPTFLEAVSPIGDMEIHMYWLLFT